ncbi:MAG: hypothetical protein CTY20_09610 [Hyphomicrobium sp.]|nr:MAG: hypothetical protein CTY20_09610 [Hyphomicrobium sp.]
MAKARTQQPIPQMTPLTREGTTSDATFFPLAAGPKTKRQVQKARSNMAELVFPKFPTFAPKAPRRDTNLG